MRLYARKGRAESRPTRARGLKLRQEAQKEQSCVRSRPTRARGLKLHVLSSNISKEAVAPHAGAWIETVSGLLAICSAKVAPHAGAWIETYRTGAGRPSRKVAPHAGAWIETSLADYLGLPLGSRAPRGRVD